MKKSPLIRNLSCIFNVEFTNILHIFLRRGFLKLSLPVIPVQTPPASFAGSPHFVDASPEFDPDSSDEDPADQASPSINVGHSPIRPKAKTLANLPDDELIDGRTAQKKRKTIDIVNFALMANIHSMFEPQTYSEAKGIPEWEQEMTSEHLGPF